MGTLLTLSLPPDSPVADLPWVITIGALDDEEDWEPVVCGPYERGHALALAQAVVADEDLMAVVEPLLPLLDATAIRDEVELARGAAESGPALEPLGSGTAPPTDSPGLGRGTAPPTDSPGLGRDTAPPTDSPGLGRGTAPPTDSPGLGGDTDEEWVHERVEPGAAPTAGEVRAAFARIAARLPGATASG